MEIEKEKNGPSQSSSKKSRYWASLAILLPALGVTTYSLLQHLKEPSVGNFRVSESSISVENTKEIKRFEGKYISFDHFNSYKVKVHETELGEEKNILERAFFSEEGTIAKKIALTVERLPGGENIEDSASYKMRKTYPDRYKKEKFSQGAVQGTKFSLNDPQFFEKVIFIQNGNLLAELALTSSLPSRLPTPDAVGYGGQANDDLNLEIGNIAGSIQWLK